MPCVLLLARQLVTRDQAWYKIRTSTRKILSKLLKQKVWLPGKRGFQLPLHQEWRLRALDWWIARHSMLAQPDLKFLEP